MMDSMALISGSYCIREISRLNKISPMYSFCGIFTLPLHSIDLKRDVTATTHDVHKNSN